MQHQRYYFNASVKAILSELVRNVISMETAEREIMILIQEGYYSGKGEVSA